MKVVVPLLAGNALQRYILLERKNVGLVSYNELICEFEKHYQTNLNDRKLRVQLREMKFSPGSNLEKFTFKFQELANKIEQIRDDDLIFTFEESLNAIPRVKSELLRQKPATLLQAIELAPITVGTVAGKVVAGTICESSTLLN